MKKILYLTIFAGLIYSQCDTYYADIDGDGDGAKSVWCSYTELPHATGGNWEDSGWETNGCGTVGWNGDTPAGHLTYGPYISTDPGVTHVTWNMLANGDVDNDGTQIATIDIFDSTSGELLAWQNINVNDFNGSMAWQDFSLSYYSSPDHVYEFRTWYSSQGGHLVLRYITHINEDADAQGAYETTTLCEGDDTSGWSLNDDDLMSLCAENSNDACWDCAGEWGGSSTLVDCCDMGDLEACLFACAYGDLGSCSFACESGDLGACSFACNEFGDIDACQVLCESGDFDACQFACEGLGNLDACQFSCNEFGDLGACQVACESGDLGACSFACGFGDIDACTMACELGDIGACPFACAYGDLGACQVACESGDLGACSFACNEFFDLDACQVLCESGDFDACQFACEGFGNLDACSFACNEFGDLGACQAACESGDLGACSFACEFGLYDQAQCCVWEFGGTPNGDANEDTNVTVTDLVLIIDNILDGNEVDLICSSDVNGDGAVDVIDIVAIIESIIN